MATTRPNESSIKKEGKAPLDQQTIKYEAMKRIEREKRAMNKKLLDEEYDRHGRMAVHKKTAKTNWTKHYENGTLDEEDMI